MIAYRIHATLRAIVFDIDGTLYTHEEYMRRQIEDVIDRLASDRREDGSTVRERIAAYRDACAAEHDGTRPSLGNTFAELFGVSLEQSAAWRAEVIQPEAFLGPDPALRATLRALSAPAHLAALTNNPVSIGHRTLATLAVREYIDPLVGLDSTFRSKPNPEPFQEVMSRLPFAWSETLFVGDRFEVDLQLPLYYGAGAILVEGVSDVYRLPHALAEPYGGRASSSWPHHDGDGREVSGHR
jgi:phosphoglycolate phosphatase/putative hydrolase of the HAD superfamily